MKIKTLLIAGMLLAFGVNISAQSTSNWIKVKSSSDESFKDPITRNASYLSVKVVNSKIYHQSDWWSNLVGKNKKAFYTINVSASYPNGSNVANRWSSGQVSIEKKMTPIEIGWSQSLVNEIPTVFTSLKIDITLGFNSVDGVDKTIGIISDISKTTPAISAIQGYMGAVTGTKAILDELFDKKLAASYISSNHEIMASSQNMLAPGYYVIFGEKTSLNYEKYKNNATKLVWNGNSLLYDNAHINDVNYVVILLEAKPKLFPVKDINILSSTELPWVKFYMKVNSLIDDWSDLTSSSKVLAEARENLTAAKALLDNDPIYIYSEKEEIHITLKDLFTKKYNKKKDDMTKNPDFFKPMGQ
ncbi:MAG TPA: hypothetical protein VK541_02175 [Pedobacter sp.]|uniref:hypothetical protein n=1 Tax=Pedobacter sp. TaxID=1411316 RepID=UPI002C14AD8C|nr:hypothetical protein [Pedobacter sp.]HMI01257.1 hypothetical protein [Pedobacter sp.]